MTHWNFNVFQQLSIQDDGSLLVVSFLIIIILSIFGFAWLFWERMALPVFFFFIFSFVGSCVLSRVMVFVDSILLIAFPAEIDIARVADKPGAENILRAVIAHDSVVNQFLVLLRVRKRAAYTVFTICAKSARWPSPIWRSLRNLELWLSWQSRSDIKCAWLLNRFWFLWQSVRLIDLNIYRLSHKWCLSTGGVWPCETNGLSESTTKHRRIRLLAKLTCYRWICRLKLRCRQRVRGLSRRFVARLGLVHLLILDWI